MLGAKSITEIQLKDHLYEFLSSALPAAPNRTGQSLLYVPLILAQMWDQDNLLSQFVCMFICM